MDERLSCYCIVKYDRLLKQQREKVEKIGIIIIKRERGNKELLEKVGTQSFYRGKKKDRCRKGVIEKRVCFVESARDAGLDVKPELSSGKGNLYSGERSVEEREHAT